MVINKINENNYIKAMTNGITIRLEDRDLWMRFYGKTNEMIVTRSGRNMFPVLKMSLSGLDPTAIYEVVVDFQQVDNHKWKYINGEWQQGTKPDPVQLKCEYKHPDSPNFGSHWMKDSISFNKIKLTNKPPNKGQIQLNSLHKYEPRIIIFKLNSNQREKIAEASFHETQFIAVTAYQNEEITSLKIKFNPFAKAFLDVRERPDRDSNEEDSNFTTSSNNAIYQPSWSNQAASTNSFYALPCAKSQHSHTGAERFKSSHRSSPYSTSQSYHQQYLAKNNFEEPRPIKSSSPLSSSSNTLSPAATSAVQSNNVNSQTINSTASLLTQSLNELNSYDSWNSTKTNDSIQKQLTSTSSSPSTLSSSSVSNLSPVALISNSYASISPNQTQYTYPQTYNTPYQNSYWNSTNYNPYSNNVHYPSNSSYANYITNALASYAPKPNVYSPNSDDFKYQSQNYPSNTFCQAYTQSQNSPFYPILEASNQTNSCLLNQLNVSSYSTNEFYSTNQIIKVSPNNPEDSIQNEIDTSLNQQQILKTSLHQLSNDSGFDSPKSCLNLKKTDMSANSSPSSSDDTTRKNLWNN